MPHLLFLEQSCSSLDFPPPEINLEGLDSSEDPISARVRELKVFTAYFSGTLPLDFILDSISQLDGLSGVDSYETIYRSPQFLSHKKARALLREFSIFNTATVEAYENLGFMVRLENLRMHTPPPPTRSSMAKYHHLPNLKTILISFEKGEIPFVQGEHLPALTNLNFWERASLSPPTFQFVKRHLSQLSNLTVPFSWELCEALKECDDLSRLELLKLNFFETELFDQIDATDQTLLDAAFSGLKSLKGLRFQGNAAVEKGVNLIWGTAHQTRQYFWMTLHLQEGCVALPTLTSPSLTRVIIKNDTYYRRSSQVKVVLGQLPNLEELMFDYQLWVISFYGSNGTCTQLSPVLLSLLAWQFPQLSHITVPAETIGSFRELVLPDTWIVVAQIHSKPSSRCGEVFSRKKCNDEDYHLCYPGDTLIPGCMQDPNTTNDYLHFASNVPNFSEVLAKKNPKDDKKVCRYAHRRYLVIEWTDNVCPLCGMKS